MNSIKSQLIRPIFFLEVEISNLTDIGQTKDSKFAIRSVRKTSTEFLRV